MASLVSMVLVDIGIAEGVPADLISAYANGKNMCSMTENVV